MALAHAETQNGTATSSSTVASASLGAGGADSGYLARVAIRSNVAVSSVAGGGLTWTLVKAQCSARAQTRVEVWKATGAGTAGAVTATLASSANAATIIVSRYTGVDQTTPVPTSVGYNTLGLNGACSGGSDNANLTGSITTANNNSFVDVAANSRTDTTYADTATWTTPANGADVTVGAGGDVTTLSAEYKLIAAAGATTFGGSGNVSSVDWCAVAVEIKEAAAAGGGMPQIIVAMDAHRAVFGG